MQADASGTRIGTELAGFRIESVLGRGGMSVVYLAEQVTLARKVALKVLAHQVLALDDTFRDRFLQESHLAAHLDHPNVIPIYDAGEAQGCLYIAMRYVEGRDLGRVLEHSGPLSLGRTLFVLDQVASALDAAHEQGLVHRDVKPANVLLVENSDRIYLTDFGVAKPTTSAGLTRTGFFIGTPDYCAPEQIEGAPVDARTDVYALGAVLYACLTATAPYSRNTEVAVLQAHLNEPPPKLSEVRADLPRGLDRVIATAMAKSKEERYATCGDLVAATRAASLDRPLTLPDSDLTVIDRPDRSLAAEPVSAATGQSYGTPPSSTAGPAPTAASAPETPLEPEHATPPAPGGPPPSRSHTGLLVGALVAVIVALVAALAVVLVTRGNGSSAGENAAAASPSKTTSFTVPLASSAEVPPSIGSSSSGTAAITITGNRVCWDFTLTGIDKPNAAHIHRGGPSVTGPVVVPLGAGFKLKSCTTAPAAAVAEILADPAGHYVNVHSVTYPDGAVRGQLGSSKTAAAGGTTQAQRAVGLAALVPKPVFKNCTVRPKPRAGAAETAVCVAPVGGTTFYPTQLELSLFANDRALSQAYAAERKKADVGTGFGRCSGTEWAGEGPWLHAPAAAGQPGKPGGQRFCYFDGNVAVMVWTHGKFGQPTHVDFLGIARQTGSDHAHLYDWWRFWHHRMGNCLTAGCLAKP
jgi:serine/threonine protein kinase